jgi:hypothetical protein
MYAAKPAGRKAPNSLLSRAGAQAPLAAERGNPTRILAVAATITGPTFRGGGEASEPPRSPSWDRGAEVPCTRLRSPLAGCWPGYGASRMPPFLPPPPKQTLTRRYDRNCAICGKSVRGLAIRCPYCHALAFPRSLFLRIAFWILIFLLPFIIVRVRR